MGKAKAIGTKGETAVVNAAHRLGWPDAKRLALAGFADESDLTLEPHLCVIQVKAGHYAEKASHEQVWSWLNETEQQRVDADVPFAFLVTKRAGVGEARAERWWAHMWLSTMHGLLGVPGPGIPDDKDHPVRLTLAEASAMIHAYKERTSR